METDSGPVWSGRRARGDSSSIEWAVQPKARPRVATKVRPRELTEADKDMNRLVQEILQDLKENDKSMMKSMMRWFTRDMSKYMNRAMAYKMPEFNPTQFKENLRYLEEGPLKEIRLSIQGADPAIYDQFIRQPYEDAIEKLKAEYREKTERGSEDPEIKRQRRVAKLNELEDIHGYRVTTCLRCGKLKL